jgi:hypothetical protein
MKRKAGRPKKGKQNREHVSIRLEPKDKALIIKTHDSVQGWVDDTVAFMRLIEKGSKESL